MKLLNAGTAEKTSSKLVRGDRIGGDLKRALNATSSQLSGANKVQPLNLESLKPNPANKRKLVIPLTEMLEALKVGTTEPFIYVNEDGSLFFPERSDFLDLGIDLQTASANEERFYDKIRELTISIFNHDELLQPVECFVTEAGDKVINHGHRRWFASHFVPNKTTCEGLVKKRGDFDDLQLSIRSWDENHKRDDPSLLDRIEHVAEVMALSEEKYGKVSQVKVGGQLGLSKSDMSYYSKIIKADITTLERAMIRSENLNDLKTVSEVCRIGESEVRIKAFKVYGANGNTAARNFVIKYLNSLKIENGKERDAAVKTRLRKVTPTQTSVMKLMDLLKQSAPEYVEGLDESSDASAILTAILKRLDDEVVQ